MPDEPHNSVELETPQTGVADDAPHRRDDDAPSEERSAASGETDAANRESIEAAAPPEVDAPEVEAAEVEASKVDAPEVEAAEQEATDNLDNEASPAENADDNAEEAAGDEDALQNEVADQEAAEVESAGPVELVEEEPDEISMDWYILKVQSNRERTIADALRRKIAIEGLDEYFADVIVPTEKVTEFKGGKKKVVERKLYPGYIVVHMHINDDTWFAVRETAGIGDFTGSGGKPTPMLPHEVARIIQTDEEETDEAPKLDIKFKPGDAVKVKEGTFEGFEGEVNEIDGQSGKVKVLINIFGRSTPVELEYWQVESA